MMDWLAKLLEIAQAVFENAIARLTAYLDVWLVPPLNSLFGPLDRFLSGLSTDSGRYCAVALFAIAAAWVLTLKRDYVFQGAPDRAWWRDLRLWSVAALAPYVYVYLFLF